MLGLLLQSAQDLEVVCTRHRGEIGLADKRVRVIDLDLGKSFDEERLPGAIDLTIHFAAVTHAQEPGKYWEMNHQATTRLAQAVSARGCRKFVYISTRCATRECGAYGESKLAAENELKKFGWESLLIVRPSEIYGAEGREGVDKLIALARQWRVTPWLFGNSRISFAPLSIEDFARIVVDETLKAEKTARIVELCGPKDLTGTKLAMRIVRRFRALPVPLWWPLFALFLKVAAGFNMSLAAPDQIKRLIGAKTATARTANRTGQTRFLLD